MVKLLLDTNFLFLPFEYKIDIVEEFKRLFGSFEIYVTEKTILEIENIMKDKSRKLKDRMLAKMALQYLKKLNPKVIPTPLNLPNDKLIIDIVKKEKFVVCTNDKNLRKVLKEIGIPTVYSTGRKLVFEGIL